MDDRIIGRKEAWGEKRHGAYSVNSVNFVQPLFASPVTPAILSKKSHFVLSLILVVKVFVFLR